MAAAPTFLYIVPSKFVAVAVFAVLVPAVNVTVLDAPFDHAPEKLHMRKIVFCGGAEAENSSGLPAGT
jgi:hypothetical protein